MACTSTLKNYPVLAEVLRMLSATERAPLADCQVLAVQHLHSSMLPLIEAMLAAGLRADSTILVGKSYSSRRPTLAALRALSVEVVDPERMRDPRQCYERELAETVESALDKIEAQAGPDAGPLVVLDEGAVATKALAGRPALAARARVVEQTTRGARWSDTANLPFPVVDVARSAAKADYEAPLVVRSMRSGLRLAFGELGIQPDAIGLVGYGRMGARLADLLSGDYQVTVFDQVPGNLALAASDGYRTCDFPHLLAESEVVIGCTGNGILGPAGLRHRAGPVTLANCASSDIEFELWERRTPGAVIGAGDPARPWTNHYLVDPDQGHRLIAGGFPTNFYCPGEPISPQEFQITRSLMLAGAMQAMSADRRGVIPLRQETQSIITAAYRAVAAQFEESA